MLENTEVDGEREKEIPVALAILGKEIEEQQEAIHSLRDALSLVLREGEEAAIKDSKEKVVPVEHSELGRKLKAYQRQITCNTQAIGALLSRLEL